MDAKNKDAVEHLLQTDVRSGFIPSIGRTQWQVVYESRQEPLSTWVVFCALLPDDYLPMALQNDSWDLHIGDGRPGFCEDYEGGKKVTTYLGFGCSTGIRPFVICRDFHGAQPDYVELCEEFRHYHNLAYDFQRNLLLDFDSSGYEIKVGRLSDKRVEVNLKHLKQFLAATRLNLAIYFDSVRYSRLPIAEVPGSMHTLENRDAVSCYRLDVNKCDFKPGYYTISSLQGKVLIPPPPVKQAGVWPFKEDDDDREVDFIIGVNEHGDPVLHSSNPDKLANCFGANPGAPDSLTLVFFRKEVLSKYYSDSSRYTVSDGDLRCLDLWNLQIDNNHPTHVVVFLKYLGRDLPYSERLHWKQFNVPPEGAISDVSFRRSFLAEFTDAESVDLVFRTEYKRLAQSWEAAHGWPIFLPPSSGDEHLIQTVRIPVTNSQAEFDEQVLTLTKLLVDSINEKAIQAEIGSGPKDEKGISKFKRFLVSKGCSQAAAVVQFLRELQTLRSSGSGHRKGETYQKVLSRLGLDVNRKADAMAALLKKATAILRTLEQQFLPSGANGSSASE